ncbi:MAG: tRNA threonylcarbamoyladenosine dehydratase [Spirochaetaceae bacterium]
MSIIFNRLLRLTGQEVFNKLQNTKVIIFGVGGVGSWCAESLVRSGIVDITIVDSDLVCVTNINRQLQATTKTVGEVKVIALRNRLIDINPKVNITAIEKIYSKETREEFDLNSYDYVIDAIDSLSCKVELISHALSSDTILYSSFGAASKIDASRVQVKQIWKTYGCPLGRLVRNRLKRIGVTKKFLCVFSDEVLPTHEVNIGCGSGNCVCPKKEGCDEVHEWCSTKKQINGSITHITGLFGFTLAGLIIQDVMKK